MTVGTPSRFQLKERCDRWLNDLRQAEWDNDFGWFRVFENVVGSNNPRIRVVIAGFRNPMRFWEQQWAGLGGNAAISLFDGSQTEILDILKTADGDDDIACDLFPIQESGSYDGNDLSPENKSTPTSIRIQSVNDLTTTAKLRRRFKRYGPILEIGIVEARKADGGRPVRQRRSLSLMKSRPARRHKSRMAAIRSRRRSRRKW
jgi:hypothetical protein